MTEQFESLEESQLIGDHVPVITFPLLNAYKGVCHGVSTRKGGVSKGSFASMNLGVFTADRSMHVQENVERFLRATGLGDKHVYMTRQVHSDRVAVIGNHAPTRQPWQIVNDMDGMVTNRNDVALVTFYADCVPLYIYDPVNHAGGVAHAGWRGTADRMAHVLVQQMVWAFGSRAEDLIAAIGPSAGYCCYEVDRKVVDAFEGWPESGKWIRATGNEKYHVDLKEANRQVFLQAGIPAKNIDKSAACTICNEQFHSYRRDGRQSGRMAAVFGLR